MSASVAVAVKVKRLSSFTVRSVGAVSTGAELTSLTVIVMVCAALMAGKPLSVTRTVIEAVLGPCASVGVQLKTPVDGSMPAPAGAPASRLKVRIWAGRSASVAEAVNVSRVCSFRVWLPMVASTGAVFGWLTTTAMVSDALEGGEALSVTRTVIKLVLLPGDLGGVQVKTPVLGLMSAPAGAPASRL